MGKILIKMKQIIFHPIFITGLIIKLFFIFIFEPIAANQWYIPFLENSISSLNFHPWNSWVREGGSLLAFPYGYVMWFVFYPLIIIFEIFKLPLTLSYEITILLVDIALLYILNLILPNKNKIILISYWLSPIIILPSYFLGYNDLIPTLLIVYSLLLIKRSNFLFSGFVLALAISAKLSMIISVPFFLIYFYNNKSVRNYIFKFLFSFVSTISFLSFPLLIFNSSILMILNNPEMGKVLNLIVVLGDQFIIYIIPLIYLLLIYFIWRIKRINFELFLTVSGIVFLIIVLLAPSSPGWFIWSVPFLAFYQSKSGKSGLIFVSIFSVFYVLNILSNYPLQFYDGNMLILQEKPIFLSAFGKFLTSLIYTFLLVAGCVLITRILREAIINNDYFRFSRKPFSIGIAGNTGSGKDTLVKSYIDLFGDHSVSTLSGDDYHLWDRQKPMWQILTHLNPMANDLERFSKDLISLNDGKNIFKKKYNHINGKMSKFYKVNSNDFIITSGLHSLYTPLLRENYDLKIYLDIDENLRKYFIYKRDVEVRGHTLEKVKNSIKKRENDSNTFIHPQINHADLIFSLKLINEQFDIFTKGKDKPLLKLAVRSRREFNELSLHRILVGVCGLNIDVNNNQESESFMIIEGEVAAEDISLAAKLLCPRIFDFLDMNPNWHDGVYGLMQLVTINHIDQLLNKRFN